MNDSFKLGKVLGIPVRVHWTFLLLLYFVAASLGSSSAFGALLFLAALLLSVLLHELGHGLVARRLGIHVVDITFWPLGGMTNMTRVPEDSRIEGLIALGGPAVNLILAGGTALALLGTEALGLEHPGALLAFLEINFFLGTLNLIPVFPMDGGRILRAWLARKADWVTATEQAVRIGRLFLVGILALAFLSPALGGDWTISATGTLCVLPVMAVFLWWSGMREVFAVRLRHGRSPFGGVGFAPHWDVRPGETGSSSQDDSHGARRPTSPTDDPRGGFSEEFVRELEQRKDRL